MWWCNGECMCVRKLSWHTNRSKTNIPQQKVWLGEWKERTRLVGVGGVEQRWTDLIRSVLHSTAVTSSTVCLAVADSKAIMTMPCLLEVTPFTVRCPPRQRLRETGLGFWKIDIQVLSKWQSLSAAQLHTCRNKDKYLDLVMTFSQCRQFRHAVGLIPDTNLQLRADSWCC